MLTDINQFISPCAAYAQAKVPWALPVGKVMPLTTPQRSWSHIAFNFIADLPKSPNYMVTMVIIKRFSKSLRFILL